MHYLSRGQGDRHGWRSRCASSAADAQAHPRRLRAAPARGRIAVAATAEVMLLHVRQREDGAGSAPFPPEVARRDRRAAARRRAPAAGCGPGSRAHGAARGERGAMNPRAHCSACCAPRSVALIGGAWADAVAAASARHRLPGRGLARASQAPLQRRSSTTTARVDELPARPGCGLRRRSQPRSAGDRRGARRARRRRLRVLRRRLLRDRRRPEGERADRGAARRAPASCPSSARTATASSTSSTAWRCGPTRWWASAASAASR